jgi:sugar O-acyltransferase (sialic acid O-acetyltransferase NeuD family)
LTVQGFFDDSASDLPPSVLSAPVLGTIAEIPNFAPLPALVAVGDNRSRARIAETVQLPWFKLVHPTAIIDPSVDVGEGTVIMAGAIVQPGACIGRHAIINTAATVDHDSVVADFGQLGPGCHLAGEVTLKRGAFAGIGSSVNQRLTMGEWSILGAGGVAISDISANTMACGVPARVKQPKN